MDDKGKAELARRLCDSGKFQEALPFFHELEKSAHSPQERAGYLIDQATCYADNGNFEEAGKCISKARVLVNTGALATAQIDFFVATLLIEEGRSEEGVQALSRILSDDTLRLTSGEGRELYEKIQVQRGFTLMHLSKPDEARPILEEAMSFGSIDDETSSRVHCHLGRYFHEAAGYDRAKRHFLTAQKLGVPADWEAIFHYYLGYTLYELREFESARRELILSLQSEPGELPASYRYKMLAAVSRKLGEHREARAYDEMARSSGKRV